MIKQFYSKTFYDSNRMCITVEVTDSCNYHCLYCYNNLPRRNDIIDLERLKKFILTLKLLTNKSIEVTLIGGEPMVLSLIDDFCKLLLDNDVWITIFSNFSVDIARYEELLKYNLHLNFHLTWHSENIDFISKLEKIKQYRSLIMVAIMYEHNYIDTSIKLLKTSKLLGFESCLMKVYDVNLYCVKYSIEDNKKYDENVKEQILYDGEFILIDDKNKLMIRSNLSFTQDNNPFKMWQCMASRDVIYILTNGDIFPCATMIYNVKHNITENRKYKLGNIYDSLIYKKMNIICPCSYCCNYEIKKINIFNKQNNFKLMDAVENKRYQNIFNINEKRNRLN